MIFLTFEASFIDKKPNLFPEVTVEEMLETLSALQFPRRKGGQLIPDELIYRACLVICGKYGRQEVFLFSCKCTFSFFTDQLISFCQYMAICFFCEDAQRIFVEMQENGVRTSQETYGAYTFALASASRTYQMAVTDLIYNNSCSK